CRSDKRRAILFPVGSFTGQAWAITWRAAAHSLHSADSTTQQAASLALVLPEAAITPHVRTDGWSVATKRPFSTQISAIISPARSPVTSARSRRRCSGGKLPRSAADETHLFIDA